MATDARNRRQLTQSKWRPVYWEPVAGTGEKLMAGVVAQHAGEWFARRILRDDVLQSLYGAGADGAQRLIDEGLNRLLIVARTAGLDAVSRPMMGLNPGALRQTAAADQSDIVRQAALLYSSLTNLDAVDDSDTDDPTPRTEDVNRHFGSQVRAEIVRLRPALKNALGAKIPIVEGGDMVRFGFVSDHAIVHFVVIHPVRQASSVSTARAKLWELEKARELNGGRRAGLVAAVPRDDDAILGPNQRAGLRRHRTELELEADRYDIRVMAVTTVAEGAERTLDFHGS